MLIIDAHIHFSRIERFVRAAAQAEVHYSESGLQKSKQENDVIFTIGMGTLETLPNRFPDNHVEAIMDLDLENIPVNMGICLGINPFRFNNHGTKSRKQLEQALQNPQVVGIKIYLGYYPFPANHRIYCSLYEMAEVYGLPIVLHAGETYHDNGTLVHAHPQAIDEVACRFRGCSFVIAHLAYPWMMDVAELAAKNPNVFTDLSGLIVGNTNEVNRYRNNSLFMDELRKILVFLDHYDKVLYGSDWPLVPMNPYIQFIQEMVPLEFHEQVFYQNALRVFPRIHSLLVPS